MTEKDIEQHLIDILCEQHNQWTYRKELKNETDLWNNLRDHINRINLNRLNNIKLSDIEFDNLKTSFLKNTSTPFNASRWLRGENGYASLKISADPIRGVNYLTLDLFSNKDICGGSSSYEVVNQISVNNGKHRGDVTLLINGLPMIQIELKAEYGKNGYMQAFDQLQHYAEEGFFNGIFATTQIFVVSNKVVTKYFARPYLNEKKGFQSIQNFLFNWRTFDNKNVDDLFSFAKQALSIPMAHELISKYSILINNKNESQGLMVLRPYQIHAIQKIQEGVSKHEGGFIWHATGSGKTITSFVATKLLAQHSNNVARTIMIVDRIDLDDQTVAEFTKFASEYQTGNSKHENALVVATNNVNELSKALLSDKNRTSIVITTIQKLNFLIKKIRTKNLEKFEKLKSEHLVLIVDECHRAVTDEAMREIKKILPRSTWFGLTGTPLFEENKRAELGNFAQTTNQQYGPLLHSYTTKNAISDRSVLSFQVEYHNTLTKDSEDELYMLANKITSTNNIDSVPQIEKENSIPSTAYEDKKHIRHMLDAIFKRNSLISKFKFANGYPTMSAILTTNSILQAKRIYDMIIDLKKHCRLINGRFNEKSDRIDDKDFPRIAITYSLASDEYSQMSDQRTEVEDIIMDYNQLYDTNFSYDSIDKYVKNVNKRLARKELKYQKDGQWIDLVIVVDRLLTGFDSPLIQTLYVDRELKWHKLLQAFSRTNRKAIGKTNGMIVTFRKPITMKKNVADSIRLFSNDDLSWDELTPREFKEVLNDYENTKLKFEEYFEQFKKHGSDNLNNTVDLVKSFAKLDNLTSALKSYDELDEKTNHSNNLYLQEHEGLINNLKRELKDLRDLSDDILETIADIEFTSERDTFKEEINLRYIDDLLEDIVKKKDLTDKALAINKLDEQIKNKAIFVQDVYRKIYSEVTPTTQESIPNIKRKYFSDAINDLIKQLADSLKVPFDLIRKSINAYTLENEDDIPHILEIYKEMNENWTNEELLEHFNESRRKLSQIIRQKTLETINKITKLEGEI